MNLLDSLSVELPASHVTMVTGPPLVVQVSDCVLGS